MSVSDVVQSVYSVNFLVAVSTYFLLAAPKINMTRECVCGSFSARRACQAIDWAASCYNCHHIDSAYFVFFPPMKINLESVPSTDRVLRIDFKDSVPGSRIESFLNEVPVFLVLNFIYNQKLIIGYKKNPRQFLIGDSRDVAADVPGLLLGAVHCALITLRKTGHFWSPYPLG